MTESVRCNGCVSNLLLLVGLYVLTKLITKFTQPKEKALEVIQANEETTEKDADPVHEEEDDDDDYTPTVKIIPESDSSSDSSSYLLTLPQMQQLAAKALPPMVALRCWKRIYRLSRDGDDFGTFLHATGGHAQTLLMVQTTQNHLFGAFADSPWDASERENYNIHGSSASGFYGSTLACLFTFGKLPKNDPEQESDPTLTVFKWSGLNRYIQLLDSQQGRIAFGGGGRDNGGFGLCIEDNFCKGTTTACETSLAP